MLTAIDNSIYDTAVFNTAIYVRLSRDDDEKYQQSESIKNQIDLLTKIVIENSWNIIDTYVDDGFTGTNFDRPAFNRLVSDIEKKRVNLVIVKDLSRLGRDYIETGNYIEKYFPAKSIRFIAVNDGIDTFANSSNNDMSPFKNVMNDHYAKDISRKVRSTFNTKRYNGKFIGSFAPYGYLKDTIDKNKLVVNPETSPVVRKIYDLYITGNSLRHIANILNTEGYPSPAKYKNDNTAYRGGRTKNFLWGPETIKLILISPTYTGNLAQRKYEKINYKLKKFKNISRDSWVVVSNTHEPIIDSSTYELVQKLLERKVSLQSNEANESHLLSGLLYCGDCGSKMTFLRGSNRTTYAVCSKYKRFKQCTRHSFPEKLLNELILNELRQITSVILDIDKMNDKARVHFESMTKNVEKDINKEFSILEKRLSEIKSIIKNLYEDKVKGILVESDFIELSGSYNKERETIYQKVENIKKQKQKTEEQYLGTAELSKIIANFVKLDSPDKITLVKLINKIQIFENRELKIFYNFKCPY